MASHLLIWLEYLFIFHSQGSGILLLTGPPGCGKTATVKVLADSLNVAIQVMARCYKKLGRRGRSCA
jgi:ATP-dependent Lon protease